MLPEDTISLLEFLPKMHNLNLIWSNSRQIHIEGILKITGLFSSNNIKGHQRQRPSNNQLLQTKGQDKWTQGVMQSLLFLLRTWLVSLVEAEQGPQQLHCTNVNFLILTIVLWLYKRIVLFLENSYLQVKGIMNCNSLSKCSEKSLHVFMNT